MNEPTELLPCPFCGSKATASVNQGESLWSHDVVDWTRVHCTNDDCNAQTEATCEGYEPSAIEVWNRRTPPAVAGEPVGYLYCGGSYGDELEDWEIVADQHQCDKLNEHHGSLGKEARLPLYATPQPTQAQAVAVPLTYQQIVAAWNAQADEHNQWDALGEDEKIEWAVACANAAPPAVVPIGWYVTGCSRILDEHDAKAEARQIGGSAKALPLCTAPAVVEPLPPASPCAMTESEYRLFKLGWLEAEAAHSIGIKKGDSHD